MHGAESLTKRGRRPPRTDDGKPPRRFRYVSGLPGTPQHSSHPHTDDQQAMERNMLYQCPVGMHLPTAQVQWSKGQQSPGTVTTMRTSAFSWCQTVLLVAAVWEPSYAMAAASSASSAKSSLTIQSQAIRPSRPPLELPVTEAKPLRPADRQIGTTLLPSRRPTLNIRARYATTAPGSVRLRKMPTVDEMWNHRPRSLIGPPPPSATATPPATLSTVFIEGSSSTSRQLPPDSQLFSNMRAPQNQTVEYDQMNAASHVALHGGN